MRAPAACTARAEASVCARVSTAHGPAITPNVPPPSREVAPRTSMEITVSGGFVSRETSFRGRVIETASATPARCSNSPGSIGPGLPVTATAMRCAPGILCGTKPSARTLSATWSTSAGVAVGCIKISIARSYHTSCIPAGNTRRALAPRRKKRPGSEDPGLCCIAKKLLLLLQLLIDHRGERLERHRAGDLAPVDEERRRAHPAAGQRVGGLHVAVDRRLELARVEIRLELLDVEADLLGVLLQVGAVQRLLVAEQLVVHLPELALLPHRHRPLGGHLHWRM